MRQRSMVFLPVLFMLSASAQTPGVGGKNLNMGQLPEVNRQVLAFVDAHMGKRVGKGQCWDLAAAALQAAHAAWDGQYKFGTPLGPGAEVLPGDIIQFEGVVTEDPTPHGRFHQSMPHHTAIVQAVHANGRYTLAHQNFGRAGRKVSLTELQTEHIVKGTFTIYRPGR